MVHHPWPATGRAGPDRRRQWADDDDDDDVWMLMAGRGSARSRRRWPSPSPAPADSTQTPPCLSAPPESPGSPVRRPRCLRQIQSSGLVLVVRMLPFPVVLIVVVLKPGHHLLVGRSGVERQGGGLARVTGRQVGLCQGVGTTGTVVVFRHVPVQRSTEHVGVLRVSRLHHPCILLPVLLSQELSEAADASRARSGAAAATHAVHRVAGRTCRGLEQRASVLLPPSQLLLSLLLALALRVLHTHRTTKSTLNRRLSPCKYK